LRNAIFAVRTYYTRTTKYDLIVPLQEPKLN
jgi:hypothetical protein